MGAPESPAFDERSFAVGDIVYFVLHTVNTEGQTAFRIKKGSVATLPRRDDAGKHNMVVSTWHSFDQEVITQSSLAIRTPRNTHQLHTESELLQAVDQLTAELGQDIRAMKLAEICKRPRYNEALAISLGAATMIRTMLDESFAAPVIEE